MINSPVIEMPELTACFTTIDCKPYMVPAHNAKQIPVVCSAAVFSFFFASSFNKFGSSVARSAGGKLNIEDGSSESVPPPFPK